MIYNSIVLINGGVIWLTQEESDSVSLNLLAEKTFVKVDRLQKVYNSSQIQSCGPTSFLMEPLVSGGEFSFSFNGLWAKKDDKEYVWNKGWKLARGEFANGKSFDELIIQMTVKKD